MHTLSSSNTSYMYIQSICVHVLLYPHVYSHVHVHAWTVDQEYLSLQKKRPGVTFKNLRDSVVEMVCMAVAKLWPQIEQYKVSECVCDYFSNICRYVKSSSQYAHFFSCPLEILFASPISLTFAALSTVLLSVTRVVSSASVLVVS